MSLAKFFRIGLVSTLLLTAACDVLLEDEENPADNDNDTVETVNNDEDENDTNNNEDEDDTNNDEDDSDEGSGGKKCSHGTEDLRTEVFEDLKDGEFTVTLEEGEVSMLVTALAEDVSEPVGLLSLIGPEDEVLYEREDMGSEDFASDLFAELQEIEGELVIYLPVGPDFDLMPGDYRFTFATADGGDFAEAFVVTRSGNMGCPQALDLNLWVLSEDSDINEFESQEELEENLRVAVESVWGQHDLYLGEVNFIEADDEQREAFASVDEEGMGEACIEMFELVGEDARALNVILVDELRDEEGEGDYSTMGISSAPGTLWVGDSPNTCALAAWEPHEGDQVELGMTIIHEGSHFMGMMHTSEADGMIFDVLGDTDECAADDFDENGDEEVDADECADAGGANYLFWGPNSGATDMTEDQAWVLRRHPLFYPVAEAP